MKKKKCLFVMMFLIISLCIPVFAAQEVKCGNVFSVELIEELRKIFRVIQIVVPILLTLLTMFDFAKAVFVQDKDGLNKAKNNFLKRAVAAMIVFFSPYIITGIMDLANEVIKNGDDCIPRITNTRA